MDELIDILSAAGTQLFQIHAVTEGTDAQAEVTVRLEEGGKTVVGNAAETVSIGDLDGDGVVAFTDLLQLLADWGDCRETCCLADIAMIGGDRTVGFQDLITFLANWTQVRR